MMAGWEWIFNVTCFGCCEGKKGNWIDYGREELMGYDGGAELKRGEELNWLIDYE